MLWNLQHARRVWLRAWGSVAWGLATTSVSQTLFNFCSRPFIFLSSLGYFVPLSSVACVYLQVILASSRFKHKCVAGKAVRDLTMLARAQRTWIQHSASLQSDIGGENCTADFLVSMLLVLGGTGVCHRGCPELSRGRHSSTRFSNGQLRANCFSTNGVVETLDDRFMKGF